MTTGPKKIENRGGTRPGSGRKPKYATTEYQKTQMLKAAKKRAKEEGKTLDDVLLDIAYDGKENTRDRLASIKIYKDMTMSKSIEDGKGGKVVLGLAIGLPERKADPAKTITIEMGDQE